MHDDCPAHEIPPKRRVLIVDDHPLLRRGLAALIHCEPDLEVSAEAATGREALEAIAASRPDLVIADLSLGADDGLELIREIRSTHEDLPVLVLSMHDAPGYVERALRVGANGYATKQEMGEAVLNSIRRVLGGEQDTSPGVGADSTDPDSSFRS